MNLWYVIQTKPSSEEQVSFYLSSKGVEVFSPLMEAVRVIHGKGQKQLKPLFPSYVFGKFDLEQNYALVRWARGVRKVLSFGGYPTPVSEDVVELIKKRTGADGVVRKTYHFASNDTVRIKSGPLKDLLGIFERWISEKERVRILLNLIGYQPTLELHCSMLEKVA